MNLIARDSQAMFRDIAAEFPSLTLSTVLFAEEQFLMADVDKNNYVTKSEVIAIIAMKRLFCGKSWSAAFYISLQVGMPHQVAL